MAGPRTAHHGLRPGQQLAPPPQNRRRSRRAYEQGNFDTYQVVRMGEAPAIDVHIVPSAEPPGGMGEPGTSAVMPAIANAVFAATGKRVRKLPINPAGLKGNEP